MDLDTNKDGKVDLVEGIAFVQGFLSATTNDVLNIIKAIGSVVTAFGIVWAMIHGMPSNVAYIPTASPPAPAPVVAPTPAPADTDAPKDTDAPVAPSGGGS